MATLRLKYKHVLVSQEYGHPSAVNALAPSGFAAFNSGLLGLGAVRKEATVTNALAAVFDLEGFTGFCSQIDPQLVIPEFLSKFLDWLFEAIKKEFTEKETKAAIRIWGSLPFFGKFTGDGVLFLWDTDLSMGPTGIGNIAGNLRMICHSYSTKFYPNISRDLAKVPRRLRVGIARGQVLSVGEDNDFVGPCINMASRLQKLGSLSFAISRRGFAPKECCGDWHDELVLKKVSIPGIGREKPVLVFKEKFKALSKEEKAAFF